MGLVYLTAVTFFFSFGLYHKRIAFDLKALNILIFTVVSVTAVVALQGLPDIGNYRKMYEGYALKGLVPGTDVGYVFLIKFFSFFGFDFFFFRTFTTVAFSLIYIRGILKCSSNLSLSLLIFFTTIFSISFLIQVRTGLGLAVIVGYGLPYYVKGKNFKFFLCVVAGSLFHVSLVTFIFPLVLAAVFKTPKAKAVIVIASLLILKLDVTTYLINMALAIANLSYISKILAYINDSSGKEAFLSNRDFLALLIMFLTFRNTNSKMDNFMFWSYFSSFFLKLLFRNFGEIAFRFYLIFQYSFAFLMPLLYKKNNFIMRVFVVALVLANFIMLIINYGSGSIFKSASF
ncbi:MAG: EpsG family protein [Spirochaetaceae bacterium]|jgi:hypothetical protein|nr:EpsG family protein [Spirochaetaceae bacterium]